MICPISVALMNIMLLGTCYALMVLLLRTKCREAASHDTAAAQRRLRLAALSRCSMKGLPAHSPHLADAFAQKLPSSVRLCDSMVTSLGLRALIVYHAEGADLRASQDSVDAHLAVWRGLHFQIGANIVGLEVMVSTAP
ncbi:hypothetical protein GOODEAATRI_032323 [Goodea atripinnis]|uniref:Uncharacterized protein n=1 Tax=Goodea atripinnis TaxID=208336 RepID=A0ABV0MWX9_9TELE